MAKKKRSNPILKVLKVVVVVYLLLILGNLIGDIYSRLGNTHTIAVSGEWNLVVVNRWNELPEDYEIELMELSNGQKIDERIYPYLQEMFDAARAEGIYPIVREGYRTEEEQQAIFDEKVQAYINEGYSRSRAERTAKEWVALPGTSEHQLGIAVDINADKSMDQDNNLIPSDKDDFNEFYEKQTWQEMCKVLTEREQLIGDLIFRQGYKQKELANIFEVNEARMSQIIRKIRKKLEKFA